MEIVCFVCLFYSYNIHSNRRIIEPDVPSASGQAGERKEFWPCYYLSLSHWGEGAGIWTNPIVTVYAFHTFRSNTTTPCGPPIIETVEQWSQNIDIKPDVNGQYYDETTLNSIVVIFEFLNNIKLYIL